MMNRDLLYEQAENKAFVEIVRRYGDPTYYDSSTGKYEMRVRFDGLYHELVEQYYKEFIEEQTLLEMEEL